METLGIYISVPFCRAKCTYCNFASGVFSESIHERYIELILRQIRQSRDLASRFSARLPSSVDSIYLGGGTPTLLAPPLLDRLFGALGEEFEVAASAEITVECAPGQIEDDVLAAMLGSGVNRVSFGVQSFIDREATATGRLHNRATALEDIDRVRRSGISAVNVDLIAGLPHQTGESWQESLDVLLACGATHASIYMLEIDEDSRLGREVIDRGQRYHAEAVPSDDRIANLYSHAVEELAGSGLAQYEISNFARIGAESRHNRRYWLREPYLGFGLDAHSMLRTMDDGANGRTNGGAVRFQASEDMALFLEGAGCQDVQPVSRREALEEAWFLGLRLNEGISMAGLELEFGYADAHSRDEVLAGLEGDALIESAAGRTRLTDCGRLLSNEVFGRLLDPTVEQESSLVCVD